MIKGKKILLGVSGSIAAYKSALLIRLLIKEGAEVKVIMTPAATTFITPLTLATLSRNHVLSDLAVGDSWANHVHLGRWADIMLIAPLSCNTLAKMANGYCDNLLLAVYLSSTCPVAVAPAMDEDMWLHPGTNENIKKLESFGNRIIPVESGQLASGLEGEGRMAEPENIISWLRNFFINANQYAGKKVLITAGPTYEAIDPVRFIGNYSSGKMGIAIAKSFRDRGAEVTLVLGPGNQPLPQQVKVIRVKNAEEMYNAAHDVFKDVDIAVMSAAVADYTVANPAVQKIKKSDAAPEIILKPTKDILKSLGLLKRKGQILVGFALETENEKENAIRKMKAKNADFMVLNSLNDAEAGFGLDTNKITIFDAAGGELIFEVKVKQQVAEDIVNTITKSYHE